MDTPPAGAQSGALPQRDLRHPGGLATDRSSGGETTWRTFNMFSCRPETLLICHVWTSLLQWHWIMMLFLFQGIHFPTQIHFQVGRKGDSNVQGPQGN